MTSRTKRSRDDTTQLLRAANEQLRGELATLNEALDSERNAVKALKRERAADLKVAREEEAKKYVTMLNDLKTRLLQNQQQALQYQRESVTRTLQAEFHQAVHAREEETRRVRSEARRRHELLEAQLREALRHDGPASSSTNHVGATGAAPPHSELQRLQQEVVTLRAQKKKTEENIQAVVEADRRKAADLRRQHDEHETELAQFKKTVRQEMQKLLEELKTKDRIITQLEREVKQQMTRVEQHRDLLNSYQQHRETEELSEEDSLREKRLLLRLSELQLKMKKAEETYSSDKRELLRKLRETDRLHAPLKQKSRQFLARNVELSTKNRQLQAVMKQLRQQQNRQQGEAGGRQKTNPESAIPSKELEKLRTQVVERDKVIAALRQAAREKDRKLDQLMNRHRKEQQRQYYRQFMELEPVAEVDDSLEDDDGEGPCSDTSHDSCLSSSPAPSSFSPPPYPSDSWNEFARKEYETLFSQLTKEHQELQRSYQLLQTQIGNKMDPEREGKVRTKLENDLFVARAKIRDLKTLLGGKETEACLVEEKGSLNSINLAMAEKIKHQQTKEAKLQSELQELRDQNELLEFRILELEECQEKASVQSHGPGTRDVWTDTENDDVSDSGVLSLPTSDEISSDMDFCLQDFKLETQHEEVKDKLLQLAKSLSNTADRCCLQQVLALLENYESKHNQTSIKAEQMKTCAAYLENAQEMSSFPGSKNGSTLHEEEFSKKYHKIFDLPIDLSAETSSQSEHIPLIDTKTGQEKSNDSQHLQESGIFESELPEYVTQSTQTECDVEMFRKTQIVDLTAEIDKLTKFREQVENTKKSLKAVSLTDVRLLDNTLSGETGSSNFGKYLKDSFREMMTSKAEADCELSQCKEKLAILQEKVELYESSCEEKVKKLAETLEQEELLKVQIKRLTEKVSRLQTENQRLDEEKCEFEEAENDTRFRCQKLEEKLRGLNEKKMIMQAELQEDKKIISHLKTTVAEYHKKRKEAKTETSYWESLVQKYEQKNFELEETEVELRYHLQLLEHSIPAIFLWNLWCLQNPHYTMPSSSLSASNLQCAPSSLVPFIPGNQTVSHFSICEAWTQTTLEMTSPSSSSQTVDCSESSLGSSSLDSWCNSNFSKCPSSHSNVGEEFHKQMTELDSIINENIDKELNTLVFDKEGCDLFSVDCKNCVTHSETVESDKHKNALGKVNPCMCRQENDSVESGSLSVKLSVPLLPCMCNMCETGKLAFSTDLKTENEKLNMKIKELVEEKEILENEHQISERLWKASESSLKVKTEELECEVKKSKDLLKNEKAMLTKTYFKELQAAKKREELQSKKISELENELQNIRKQLEDTSTSIALSLADFDADEKILNDTNCFISNNESSFVHDEDHFTRLTQRDRDALGQLRSLIHDEDALKRRIFELEKKEVAYKETLQQADSIWANMENEYKKQIASLEESEAGLKQKVNRLEESEQRLRQTVRLSRRSSEMNLGDLLERLMEVEKSEISLKDLVHSLEKERSELRIGLLEHEHQQDKLKSELHDQEELLNKMRQLEMENSNLMENLSRLEDLQHQVKDYQQTESYLKGRIEELELTESSLRETLAEADSLFTVREKKMKEELNNCRDEIQNYKNTLQDLQLQAETHLKDEGRLKKEINKSQKKCEELQQDTTEKLRFSEEKEESLRAELMRMRSQLSRSHGQLNELECTNGELKEEVDTLETKVKEMKAALELQKHGEEQTIIKLNLELSNRDQEISELRRKWEDYSARCTQQELDMLEEHEDGLTEMARKLQNTFLKMQGCEMCSQTSGQDTADVITQLKALSAIISGVNLKQRDSDEQVSSCNPENLQQADLQGDSCSTPGDVSTLGDNATSRVSIISESGDQSIKTLPIGANRDEKLEELEQQIDQQIQELVLLNTENSLLQQQIESRDKDTSLKK